MCLRSLDALPFAARPRRIRRRAGVPVMIMREIAAPGNTALAAILCWALPTRSGVARDYVRVGAADVAMLRVHFGLVLV